MHALRELNSTKAHLHTEMQPQITWLCRGAGERKTVHLVGLGDVGQNVAIGLALAGGEDIESIGIFDLNEKMCRRMEMELGQIRSPMPEKRIPCVEILTPDNLFACDIFLFCATKTVPAIGSGVQDVRMAQYEANAGIVSLYARQAAEEHFRGLFGVVSDPVDLLCAAAYRASCEESSPLNPWQIQGFGLGVMNARAAYYAQRDPRFASYLTEGRAFGPHGQDLVIANSVQQDHYDDRLSRELTELTVKANMAIRELGFKPYIAPAMSSAVLTLLSLIKGEWNYSAGLLNGIYFGARNRTTAHGLEFENILLPDLLFERVEQAYRHLEALTWN